MTDSAEGKESTAIPPLKTKVSPLDVMVESGALPVERPGRYDIRAFLLRGESMKPGEQ